MSTITKVVITRGDIVKFQVFFSIILLMFFIDWFTIFINRILVIMTYLDCMDHKTTDLWGVENVWANHHVQPDLNYTIRYVQNVINIHLSNYITHIFIIRVCS